MLPGPGCSLQGHGMSFRVLAPGSSCLPFPKGLLGEKKPVARAGGRISFHHLSPSGVAFFLPVAY